MTTLETTNHATCDQCGFRAHYTAKKDDAVLNFCGSHVRQNSPYLLQGGFYIEPENFWDFEAEQKLYNKSVKDDDIEYDDGEGMQEEDEDYDTTDKYSDGVSNLDIVSKLMVLDPQRCIMEKLLPTATELSRYDKSVRIFIKKIPVPGGIALNLTVEPVDSFTSNEDETSFNQFREVLFTLVGMVTENAKNNL